MRKECEHLCPLFRATSNTSATWSSGWKVSNPTCAELNNYFFCCCPTIWTNLRGIAPMLFIQACLLLVTHTQGSVHIAALLLDVHRRRHQIVGGLPSKGDPALLLSDFGEDLLWLSFCQLMLSAGSNALEWYIADAESSQCVSVNVPQLKPWGSSSVGWEGSVCSCFPTPVHPAMHTSAALPATPAAVLQLWGFKYRVCCHEISSCDSDPDIELLHIKHFALAQTLWLETTWCQ